MHNKLLFSSVVLAIALHGCSARSVEELLDRLEEVNRPQKREEEGNPCKSPEKPFPCKKSDLCIPLSYLCDDNLDCGEDDTYDEDPDVCTAYKRPTVEDIQNFVESEKSWVYKNLFDGKPMSQIVHGLAVSKTPLDFKKRIGLSDEKMENLCEALAGVKNGNEQALEKLGMQPKAWNDVVFFFSTFIKTGFEC